MEKNRKIYLLGSFILFIGLMGMMAPHFIYHTHPDGSTSKDHQDDLEHVYLFTFPSVIPTLLGLYLIERSNKRRGLQ